MHLSGTSDVIRVSLGSDPATEADLYAVYEDYDLNGKASGRPMAAQGISAATAAVTLVSAPAADHSRRIKEIVVHNADTGAVTAHVEYYDGTNARTIAKAVLQTLESLCWSEGEGWYVLTSTGAHKLAAAPDNATLADGKIWMGNASNVAAAVTPSGHGTITNAGVINITNLATTAAGDAAGDLLYRDAGTTFERLAKGTKLQNLQMNAGATAPEWGPGAVVRSVTTDILTAAVKTLNTTPVVVLDHSALVSAGICAAGDAVIFKGAVISIYGGTTDYDQDGDCLIRYTGGADLSLTLDDFFNDGTDGSIATMKEIATDIAYNAVLVDTDLELYMSASPFNAAGDRNCRITVFYSVFTPHA